jgi:hypothetical protein
VAKTFNVPLEFHEELWEQILERYKQYGQKPTENNKRQAYIPANSIPIPNPVGTAPAFAYELGTKVVISLPGVPREMEYLIEHFVRDYLKRRYGLQETVIKPWVIHTISKGESNIDEIIGDLEELSNPTVGLLAHPGQTDIRVTAKAGSLAEAERMMAPVLQRIREQLGKYIYGENETTLEEAVGRLIADHNVSVEIIEVGTKGEILSKLKSQVPDLANGEFIDSYVSNETLKTLLKESQAQQNADLALGVRLVSNGDKQDLLLVLRGEEIIKEGERSYGGPPGDGQIWAVNSALDYLRRYLIEN